MSIKIHYLSSHLDHFPENFGAVSGEQGERSHQDIEEMEERCFVAVSGERGERSHQDIEEMEERCVGRLDQIMMADYCWSLKSKFKE